MRGLRPQEIGVGAGRREATTASAPIQPVGIDIDDAVVQGLLRIDDVCAQKPSRELSYRSGSDA
jgi:hypothetical protein